MSDEPKTCLTDGSAPSPGYTETKENGQQVDYLVLCPEERAKGFVRPLRRSYRHVGTQPKHPLRSLTLGEQESYWGCGYVAYEECPPNSDSLEIGRGRLWTASQLANKGCGTVTTMGLALAETYARNPYFYCGTFCTTCRDHFPVGREGEFVWDGTNEKVGT